MAWSGPRFLSGLEWVKGSWGSYSCFNTGSWSVAKHVILNRGNVLQPRLISPYFNREERNEKSTLCLLNRADRKIQTIPQLTAQPCWRSHLESRAKGHIPTSQLWGLPHPPLLSPAQHHHTESAFTWVYSLRSMHKQPDFQASFYFK